MRLPVFVSGVLAAGLLVSLLINIQQRAEIAALHDALDEARSTQPAPAVASRTASAAGGLGWEEDREPAEGEKPPLDEVEDIAAGLAEEDPSLILGLPEVEEAVEAQINNQLAERRRVWQERHLEKSRDFLDGFAEEHELDEETHQEVESLMEEALADIATLREQRHGGSIDDDAAFEELGALRDDFRADLADLIGEDEAGRFQGQITGPLSARYY